MTDVKPPTGKEPTSSGGDTGGGAGTNDGATGPGHAGFNNLGNPNSGNILENEYLVVKHAVEQSNEDTKDIMEHVKGDPGGNSLGDVHLQDLVERQSPLQNLESNILNKTSDTSDALISKGGGGAHRGGTKKRLGLGMLAALALIGLAGGAAWWFLFAADTNKHNPGPPDITMPEPGPPDQPVLMAARPPHPCGLVFESPADAAAIPLSGPLNVQWSAIPGALSYTFEVIPPAGDPWVIPTDRTSKKIYMENFAAGGQYKFTLKALDRSGTPLCTAELVFDKPALSEEVRQKQDSEGGSGLCVRLLGC